MQKYIVAGSIKEFLIISANLKLKIKLAKTHFLLQDHTEENVRMGVLGSYLCLRVI